MSKLIDLKRTPSDKGQSITASPADADRYPYGTRIHLGDQEMDKLGIEHAQVGDKLHLRGHALVVSKSQDSDGTDKRMEIHVTKMHLKKHGSQSGMVQDKASEGAKGAMDEALQGQEAETSQASGSDD